MYGEYLNMVINMSADEFFDMMWNQKNEIYQDILEYEEVFDFAWRKFYGLKLDGPAESRRSYFYIRSIFTASPGPPIFNFQESPIFGI